MEYVGLVMFLLFFTFIFLRYLLDKAVERQQKPRVNNERNYGYSSNVSNSRSRSSDSFSLTDAVIIHSLLSSSDSSSGDNDSGGDCGD